MDSMPENELVEDSLVFRYKIGEAAHDRTWWQVAVRSEEPELLVAHLRAAGFDATTGSSRLGCPAAGSGVDKTPLASAAMAEIVYVPAYPELPAHELVRLADLILGACA